MTCQIVRAPEYVSSDKFKRKNSLFLCGGISGCPDWQTPFAENLKAVGYEGFIVNPRQDTKSGLVFTPDKAVEQIKWEHYYLNKVQKRSFWFPKETVCPITLFELGKFAALGHGRLYIGIEPGYSRQLDVETQIQLMIDDGIITHDIEFVYSLCDLRSQLLWDEN